MRNFILLLIFAFSCFGIILFAGGNTRADSGLLKHGQDLMSEQPEGYPVAVFAGGCFWCTESEYRAIDGVLYTRVGYMGGDLKDPSYEDVTTGNTGHAEVVEITYDPEKVSYGELVEFFLTKAHDPTQLNRQGVDKGTQYRSAIFPENAEEEKIARDTIAAVEARGVYKDPIVTAIEPIGKFWEAEGYHQQYYEKYEDKTGKPHIRVLMKKAGKL